MKIITPEIVSVLLIDLLCFGVLLSVLPFSIKVARYWDINSATNSQYALEKKTYLVSTVVRLVLVIKILTFSLYVFTLDKLNIFVTGAMCVVGVMNSTVYGSVLMWLKVFNIFFFGVWVVLHSYDLKRIETPFTKLKFKLFLIIFTFYVVEVLLVFLQFSSIDPMKVVTCCSTIYSGDGDNVISLVMGIDTLWVLVAFYGLFLLNLLFYFIKKPLLHSVVSVLFFFIALLALASFFSTYVYELPTHKCPFCILQGDYYYIGFVFYAALFSGTFCGLCAGLFRMVSSEKAIYWMRWSAYLNSIFTLAVSCYPLFYYMRNGVWL